MQRPRPDSDEPSDSDDVDEKEIRVQKANERLIEIDKHPGRMYYLYFYFCVIKFVFLTLHMGSSKRKVYEKTFAD